MDQKEHLSSEWETKNFRVWSSWWSPVGLGIFLLLGSLSLAVLIHALAELVFAFHRW
jgi:hypothetical protein